MLLRIALLAQLPLLAFGAVQRRQTPSQFELYAYGERFGGLPMFYADGKTPNPTLRHYRINRFEGYAYLGDHTLSNSSDAREVIRKPPLLAQYYKLYKF